MRSLTPYILENLEKKMVFIGGPRHLGKTTLAKAILQGHFPNGRYFNWDFDEDRRAILDKRWRSDQPLLVFDELHKYPRWKSSIKGTYDVFDAEHAYLVIDPLNYFGKMSPSGTREGLERTSPKQ